MNAYHEVRKPSKQVKITHRIMDICTCTTAVVSVWTTNIENAQELHAAGTMGHLMYDTYDPLSVVGSVKCKGSGRHRLSEYRCNSPQNHLSSH